jgi:transcriptional regulator with XRE-family HTH domain
MECMTLKEYMKANNLKLHDLAEKLGCSISLVSRLRSGSRRPGWAMSAKIKLATGGAVTRDDFYEEEEEINGIDSGTQSV